MKGAESILGHGIDIVEIERIARALAEHPQRFPERIFTVTERPTATSPRAAGPSATPPDSP